MSDRLSIGGKVYPVIKSDKDGIRRRCLRVYNANGKLSCAWLESKLIIQAIPGVLEYEGARIQLLDLPGIVQDAAKGELCPYQKCGCMS